VRRANLLLLLLLGLLVITLTRCGTEESTERAESPPTKTAPKEELQGDPPAAQVPAVTPAPGQQPEAKPAEALSYEEWLRMTITEVAGGETNAGRQRIESMLFFDEAKSDLEIVLWADDNLTPGLIRDGTIINSASVLRRIFADPRAKKVTLFWQLPAVGAGGQATTALVTRIIMTRETAGKIRWSEFMPLRLLDVADGFHVYPMFQ